MSDPNWVEWQKYTSPEHMYQNEIGKIAGVRFVETTEGKIFTGAGASGMDIYSTLIIAANAYGTTNIEGGGLQLIVKQKGSAGTADPLDQRSTVGWKATKTAERLVEDYMVRIETACTFNG
jgi:N4-gp56 family major capsid protein